MDKQGLVEDLVQVTCVRWWRVELGDIQESLLDLKLVTTCLVRGPNGWHGKVGLMPYRTGKILTGGDGECIFQAKGTGQCETEEEG